ncbi:MAG: hypothetical protein AAF141_09255 [Pseudomonadota bacterium]
MRTKFLLSTLLIFAAATSSALAEPQSDLPSVLKVDPNPQGFEIEAPPTRSPFGNGADTADDSAPADNVPDMPAERITEPARLPDAVKQMRANLLKAARSGDIRKLARYADPGNGGTQLTIATDDFSGNLEQQTSDALDYIEKAASDPSSVEALAILIDILELDPVLFAAGTADETYVWPWFWAQSPSELTPSETVELLRVVTWFDLEEMRVNDSYTFYRLGIAPDGRWRFFISGD